MPWLPCPQCAAVEVQQAIQSTACLWLPGPCGAVSPHTHRGLTRPERCSAGFNGRPAAHAAKSGAAGRARPRRCTCMPCACALKFQLARPSGCVPCNRLLALQGQPTAIPAMPVSTNRHWRGAGRSQGGRAGRGAPASGTKFPANLMPPPSPPPQHGGRGGLGQSRREVGRGGLGRVCCDPGLPHQRHLQLCPGPWLLLSRRGRQRRSHPAHPGPRLRP